MTSVRQQLPATAQALLLGASPGIGAGVYLWRDWSLDPSILPAVVLSARRAERADITAGNGIPNFMATVYLDVECIASAAGAQVGAAAAENAAETLAEDKVLPLLAGLIIGPPQTFRRIVSVESEIQIKADGKAHVATVSLRLAFEYEEQYAPALTRLLTQIVIVAVKPDASPTQIAAIEAALNAGSSDATVSRVAKVLAGADFTIPSS